MTNHTQSKYNSTISVGARLLILILLASILSSCGTVLQTPALIVPNSEATPPTQDPSSQELPLVTPTVVETVMPTITSTPEPSATATQVIELENTICDDCLLPRAIQKDYEGVYEGITVKFSFAIDKTMLKHFPGTIVDFDLNVQDYPELPEVMAKNILKIHYLGWKSDNSYSLTSFDDYIEMVKTGGGQYTTVASVDDLSIPKTKRVEFKLVTVDPRCRVTFIYSIEPNILAQNQSESIWPVQTIEGNFEIRRTGRIMTSLIESPEHTLGRYWAFMYLNNAMGHFICMDDLKYAKMGLWPSYGISPLIIKEMSIIINDVFNNERGKNTSPPYFHIDYSN